MTKVNEVPAAQYVAVEGYYDGIPIFNKEIIWASDQEAAKLLFDAMDVSYVEVMVYEVVTHGEIFDDET